MMPGFLRCPDIRNDLLTFCAGDDVWLAPAGGGRAWRLTSDHVPVRNPRFSPDGQTIAWASMRDAGWEVYVCDIEGGPIHRLTYFGSHTTCLLGWDDDEAVIVASAARSQERTNTTAYRVGLDGSTTVLPYGPVAGLAYGLHGLVLSSRAIRAAAEWKRYRGGTASKLWWQNPGDRQWHRVLGQLRASLESPCWVGDELIFASDFLGEIPGPADEQANLFSLPAEQLPEAGIQDLRQRTFHTRQHGYVREPVTDGTRIVYHCRGVVYRMDSLVSEPVPVEIQLPPLPRRQRRQLTPDENLNSVLPDHRATGSVLQWRGKAFYLTHREGPARALYASSGVRVREPQPLGDTGNAIMISDQDGTDRVEIHPLDGLGQPRVLDDLELGRVLHLACDRRGTTAALISHDGRISVLDVASGMLRHLGVSTDGEATGPAFSPDGRYLVWSQPVGQIHAQLMCVDLRDSNPPRPLTSGRFADRSPSFTADGKYLAFLSVRTFDPSYDVHAFELAFPSGTRPYLAPVSTADPPPFGPSVDGWPLTDTTRDEHADSQDPIPQSPELDAEGFEDRLVPFPVPAGRYRSLQSANRGVLWIHEAPDAGVLGSARAGVPGEGPADQLERFDFTTRTVKTLRSRLDDYAVSGDTAWLVARHGDNVTVCPADREIKDDDPAEVAVDLERLRFELDPVAEWRHMFDETIRLMRDHYWRADLDGVDLEQIAALYRPLVDRLGSHDDLLCLLWEVGGEMNTSHAYAIAPQTSNNTDRTVGLLGADFSRDGDGWVIERVLPGESSDPDARSPLRAAGVDAQPGDRIISVDGQPVDPMWGPAASLVGAAAKPVELVLRRPGAQAERRVIVVPLSDEQPLRYQDWVTSRKAYVADAGGGRLGYVHVPDMMAGGWAQLHRELEEATRYEGVIVDVRFNTGGHTSQLVIERLTRRVVAWSIGRHHAVEEYPSQAPKGPVVFVANEYSGSDGDIVNGAAQAMGAGPVVGTRTWGGVVGIDHRFDLMDGTRVSQPRYAFWIDGPGWTVENHGIDPDIEVPITPDEWHSSADRQLDRAIDEALGRLAERPAASPPEPGPPRMHRLPNASSGAF